MSESLNDSGLLCRIRKIKEMRWWAWPDGSLIMVSQMDVSQKSVECPGGVAVGGAE